jgi:hypothetical protein
MGGGTDVAIEARALTVVRADLTAAVDAIVLNLSAVRGRKSGR